MNSNSDILYYAWDEDGRCSDGHLEIDDALTVAIHDGFRYVVVGFLMDSIEIIMDLEEEEVPEEFFGFHRELLDAHH